MIRLIFVFIGAVGLILLMAFVAARLIRARTEGISVRLQVFLALGFIVGAFAFGLGLLVLDRIEARATLLASEAARDEAAAIAAFIGGQMEVTGSSLDDVVRTLEMEKNRAGASRTRLALSDAQGTILFAEGTREDEPGVVLVSAPIETSTGVAGHVHVAKPTIIMRRLLADFAPTVLLISAILGAAAAAAAALIGRAIASPIEQLTGFAERVSQGELKAKPPVAHGLEVKRLTKAIETMRRELEGRPYVETFAADLSHELKNPVAAIRASAEVLDEGALAEPEEAARFVKRIREATSRIEVILAELLSLARIESRGVEAPELLDVVSVVRQSVEAHATRGPVSLEVEGAGFRVRADRRWLRRAIDNLVQNAVLHGDGTSPVRVRLSCHGGQVTLSVFNSGRIASHVRQRLFRRFVTTRGDKGGTGLGLAIVRAVAEAHGGSVAVYERNGSEIEFRLELPAA